MDPKQFGAFLAAERAEKGLTQKELGEKLGVTDKAVSKWERGVCLPDVAKFDDIAAALDMTDLEVLRAKRLPPEPAPEKTPPFMTRKELGALALTWLAITTLMFELDLLEMWGISTYIALSSLIAPLLTSVLAVWYAFRCTQGIKRIDWRGVCIYALVCAVLFLLFVLAEDYFIHLWTDGVNKLFGLVGLEWAQFDYSGAWFERINAYIVPWSPRWVLYWFLTLRIFDIGPFCAFALGYAVYPVAKMLFIQHNHRREIAAAGIH